jgi:hypothetical protein
MKKVLLTLLAALVLLGLFAAVGYAGYRVGYIQGAQRAQSTVGGQAPELRPFDGWGPRRMPMHDFGFDRDFPRGVGMHSFPMMGFGFFSPLLFLGRLAVLAFILWFVYWLFTRSGWQLTWQTTETVPPPKTENE